MTKQGLKRMVSERDFDGVTAFARRRRRALSVLYAMTFNDNPEEAWRAVTAVGVAARVKATEDLEKVRDFMRRCIWMMNDESGGLGWRSPEVLGEVLFNVPELLPEFGGLLFHYFRKSPFERGAVAAVSRFAGPAPELISANRAAVADMLSFDDGPTQAYAILSLQRAGLPLPENKKRYLLELENRVIIYDHTHGKMRDYSFRDLIEEKNAVSV